MFSCANTSTSCVLAYKIHFIYLSPAFHYAIVFTRFSNGNTLLNQQSISNNGNVKCIFHQNQLSNRDILFQKSFGLLVCMRNSYRPVIIINENTMCCSSIWNNASWSLFYRFLVNSFSSLFFIAEIQQNFRIAWLLSLVAATKNN